MNLFKKVKIIYKLFETFKTQTVVLFTVISISGFLESLNLAVLYPIINNGLEQKSRGMISKFFDHILSLFGGNDLFISSCYLLILITVISVGFKALNYFLSYKFVARNMATCYKEVFDKYVKADYDFFIRNKQGKLIHTGTIASDQTAYLILLVITTVTDLLTLLLMLSLLILLTWQGAFLILAISIVYIYAVKNVLRKVIYKSGFLQVEADREKSVILNEMIMGIKAIKVFGVLEVWRRKYHEEVNKAVHNLFKMMMGKTLPELLNKLIFFVVMASLGILISIKGKDNILVWLPTLGTFAVVASRLFQVSQKVGNGIMRIAGRLPNVEKVLNMLNDNTNKIPDGTKLFREFHNKISFNDVWFAYGSGNDYLFKGININIKKNKINAIVGPTGSGKTTLLNLLFRLYTLDKGKITIDGIDISEFTYQSFLATFGYVSQETFIMNDTIRENIKFGMENCSEEMMIESAKKATAHEFIINTQDAYDTIVGDAGIKLSGGQRQLIAIARSLLRKPEIIVLDEATSSLDNISEKAIQETIKNISKHATLLVIAHRLSTIKNADKIFVVYNGKIVEEGNHESLLINRGLYFDLYNSQIEKGCR